MEKKKKLKPPTSSCSFSLQPSNQPIYWTLIVGWKCWNPIWLVVYLPLWKIGKSVGIIHIPNIWKKKSKFSTPPTSYSWWFSTIFVPHTMLHHGGFDPTETLHRSAPPKVTRSRMDNAALDWSWTKSIWLNYNIGIYICFEIKNWIFTIIPVGPHKAVAEVSE